MGTTSPLSADDDLFAVKGHAAPLDKERPPAASPDARDRTADGDTAPLPGIFAGLALQPWLPATTFLDAVVGTSVGAGIVILLMNFWYWWRGEEGMGLGDVNMMALIGAFLGWQGVLITLLLGALSGALVGILLMIRGRLQMKSKLPFGTFLAFAAIIALFAGDRLIAYYSHLLFR